MSVFLSGLFKKIRTHITPTKEGTDGLFCIPRGANQIHHESHDDYGFCQSIIESTQDPRLGDKAENARISRRNFRVGAT